MERKIEVGKVYKHFKGTLHKVLYIAKDSETLADMVVYTHEDTKEVWVRPYAAFNSYVDREKYPDCVQLYRFEEIHD